MESKKISLTEYIKSKDFYEFQTEMILYNKELKEFKDELFGSGDKFDDICELEDVFLLQKKFYDDFEEYLIFPIAAKFVYEKATDADCQWCWDSKTNLDTETIKEFMEYLLKLIEDYEKEEG